MRALFTGDWHLMGLSRFFNDSIRLQMRELNKIFVYAVENGIDHVIVCGDISHTPFLNDTALIELINLILSYDKVLNIYYIFGNHDYHDDRKTSMEILKFLEQKKFFSNLHIFLEPEQREIDGELINFLPWPRSKAFTSKRSALNVCHVEQAGALNDNGYKLKTKNKFRSSKKDWTISGHIHKHQKLGRFIYCGSPYQTKFGENYNTVGFLDVKFNDGVLKFKHVKTRPEFRLITKRILDEKDFDIPEEPNKLYNLKVDSDITVPLNLTRENSSIYSVSGRKSVNTDVEVVSEIPEIDIDTGLSDFLTKKNLTKKELRYGLSIIQKIKEKNLF